MMDPILPLIILGVVVLIHLTFVNINIGLGFYSLILRWQSRMEALESAKRVFKFMVATEVVSGVYGTIITVILAGLWTPIVNIVTTVLFIPLIISIIGIIIRLTSIVAYWYTWDRVNAKIHLAIGVLMVVSGLMIPAGFRYIFALINYPIGIYKLEPISGNPIEALSNPVYPPLLLHTWFGALSIGILVAASFLSNSLNKDSEIIMWSRNAALLGSILIIPQGLTGFWFWSVLSYHSKYLFNSINQSFLPVDKTAINMSHSFLAMVLLGLLILILGIFYYFNPKKWFVKSLPYLAIASLIMGEITHDLGRYPYLVIMGERGLEASLFINRLIIIEPYLILIGISLILLITAFFIILLYYYIKREWIQ